MNPRHEPLLSVSPSMLPELTPKPPRRGVPCLAAPERAHKQREAVGEDQHDRDAAVALAHKVKGAGVHAPCVSLAWNHDVATSSTR